MLTIDEVAATLKVSERTVLRLVKSGALPSVRVRTARRIELAALDAFIAANRTRPSTPAPAPAALRLPKTRRFA